MFDVRLEGMIQTKSKTEWENGSYHIIISNDNIEWPILVDNDSLYKFKNIYNAMIEDEYHHEDYEEDKKGRHSIMYYDDDYYELIFKSFRKVYGVEMTTELHIGKEDGLKVISDIIKILEDD